jgi:GNAT superfamily N-acetyltransferase
LFWIYAGLQVLDVHQDRVIIDCLDSLCWRLLYEDRDQDYCSIVQAIIQNSKSSRIEEVIADFPSIKSRLKFIRRKLVQHALGLEIGAVQDVLAGDLKSYDYLDSVASEIVHEAKLAGVKQDSKVAFVGCGPFPQSALQLVRDIGCSVFCLDRDFKAVQMARLLVDKLEQKELLAVECADGRLFDYDGFSHVFIASLVPVKEEILESIASRGEQDVTVLLRYGNGIKKIFNYSLESIPDEDWTVANSLTEQTRLYDVVVLKRRTVPLHFDCSEILFQPVEHDNCDVARQLCLNVIREIYGFDYSPAWASDLNDIAGHYVLKEGGIFYTAMIDGKVIGAAALRCINRDGRIFNALRGRYGDGNRVGMITRAYVQSSLRGRGIGRKLVDNVEAFACQLKYRTIYLHTHRTPRFDSVRFWSGRGYKVFFEENDAEQTVHMEKKLY